MARLRSPAQRAPQTREQALALADRFAALSLQRNARLNELDASVQQLQAAADAVVLPIEAELKDIAKQIKPWFAASLDELTGGKRKSIRLGGCLIGYRIGNPTVSFGGGTDDVAAEMLVGAALDELVRIKISPDKAAILRLLDFAAAPDADEADLAKAALRTRLEKLGFARKQTETFFVDLAIGEGDVRQVEEAA